MGHYLILISFIAALLSTVLYILAGFRKQKIISFARLFFNIAVIGTISSAAYLLYLIITHQFQYTYVWNYSSTGLPIHLLVSTFYAGQEGSFHLWALFMALLGVFLLSFISRKDLETTEKFEPPVMSVYSLVMTFLLFILILKSPYPFVWESFPKDVEVGYVPLEGRGLNPLLQNFWMAIHPPILFLGFSAITIPFCFAVAALIKNKYNRWVKLSLPWALFAALSLGAGIMIGGYWAYGVLGWGGYWGWDPVENSSLVPWILIVAGLHSMLAENNTGKFIKTSLLLCVLAFVTVLYSTFLTRSGILGDSSVHSFVDPGQEVYLFLILFLALFGIIGIGLILFRLKGLKSEKTEKESSFTRENALFLGTILLCASALIIGIGTSWPIISKGTIEPAFYNKMNLPLAILIVFINAFSLILRWKHSDEKTFLKSLYLPFGIAFGLTVILVILGLTQPVMILFSLGILFAVIINIQIAYKIILKNRIKSGAYVAHIGIMIFFLGVIGSGVYTQENDISLPLDEPREVLGYKLTYKGATPIKGDEDKYHFNVVVEKDGKAFLLQPVMFYSDYSEGIMKNPDIANLLTKDLYLSPVALEVPEEFSKEDVIELKKGEEKEIGEMKIRFIDFDKSKLDTESMQSGQHSTIGAEINVTHNGNNEKLIVEQLITEEGIKYLPVNLRSTDKFAFYLANVNVKDDASIGIAVVDSDNHKHENSPEVFVATASIKPFINLVWLGTIIMSIGFIFAIINRYKMIK